MKLKRLLIILFGLGLLTQFNNCGAGSDSQPFTSALAACDPQDPNSIIDPDSIVPNTNCALPDQLNISITPNIYDLTIGGTAGDFTVGGTCNAGGYPSNVISWSLNLQGTPVRNSSMDSTTYGTNMNSQCIDGTYTLYVELAGLNAGDTFDRTGLMTPSGYAESYQLVVTITAYTSTGQAVPNATYGTRTITLNP